MGNTNLKRKVISGLAWKFAERISAQLVTFVVSIFLARLLEPSHYGAIAIVNIFIAIANVFVDSGLGSSLVQKKDADNIDFSSVFFCNVLLSIVIYAVLFYIAPYIAKFYNISTLSPVLRVLGLRIIVASINSVQHAYVSRHMLFKRFFWSTFSGTVVSGIVGIVLAYKGFGIWALVAQYMTNTTVDTIVLWVTVKWRPEFKISLNRLGRLFSYGWKILVSSFLATAYSKIKGLIIGKIYAPESFAYYSKGDQFPSLIVTNINSSIQGVLFPALSDSQDKKSEVKMMIRRSIRISSYIMFPMMTGLALIARPFVCLILTKKWIPCIPYLQIACFIYALMPIHTANLQAIKALGHSDVYLKLEIIKKLFGITVFLLVVRFGVLAVALSGAFISLISSFINAAPNKKILDYSFLEQIFDLLPAVFISFAMGICVFAELFLPVSDFLMMTIQLITGIVTYIMFSKLFGIESYIYIKKTITSLFKEKVNDND